MATIPTEPDGLPEFTQREIQKIWSDIQDTLAAVKEIDVILANEMKNAKTLVADDNVIHIVPRIFTDFDIVRPRNVRIDELVGYYSTWVEDLYTAVILNKGKFKNKRLAKHILGAHSICNTLQKILENHSKK